jgi:hypothetical protein
MFSMHFRPERKAHSRTSVLANTQSSAVDPPDATTFRTTGHEHPNEGGIPGTFTFVSGT